MARTVYLRLGNLAIDTGRESYFSNRFLELFQPQDECEIDYVWDDGDGEEPDVVSDVAFRRPLRDTVTRLDLLGYTLDALRERYDERRRHTLAHHEESRPRYPNLVIPDPPSFDEFRTAVNAIDVRSYPADYERFGRGDPWKDIARAIVAKAGIDAAHPEARDMASSHRLAIEDDDPLVLLRLLAENPANLDVPITWYAADAVAQGYYGYEDLKCGVQRKDRFLIVTEGSSDIAVISHALDLLRPDIRDFCDFIDMTDNYPLTGIGNLHNFYQGLLKIGILNQVLVIYDNDAEGATKFAEATTLDAPPNLRIMLLPDLPAFAAFPTIGPGGEQAADIRGRAVAIECFLDLTWQSMVPPRVRWTSYNRRARQYQGELEGKEDYVRRFLALQTPDTGYDFGGLRVLLDRIVEHCADIAGATYYD